MRSLTRREHWDAVHAFEHAAVASKPNVSEPVHWARRAARRALGTRFIEYMSSYDDHQIWNFVYRPHMPGPGASVVEIGSAPGEHLAKLSQTFGLVPYGIEYSDEGVAVNQKTFASHGLDPSNVIPMDFFSDECLRYREHFDVVVSRGFVEHFEDPKAVIDRHLELLKPGGLLIVSVPNLRGVNGALTRFFHDDLMALHNLGIMSKAPFLTLFDPEKVRPLVCRYVGTFSFYLFSTKSGSRLAPLLQACMKAQALLNVGFRSFFGDRGAENRFTSPQLIFAGVKR
jgi:2-polyprenyl-3-methyl-5-hydroxy-6-metoxy-1,4-benzoquinol methylase